MNMTVNVTTKLRTKEVMLAVKEAARLAMRDTVRDIHQDALHGSRIKTGNNRRSLAGEVSGMGLVISGGEGGAERIVNDASIEGAVYSTSGYGGILEVGSPPHIIRVKTAKVLTDGTTFFGKEVHHPGTAARPYFKPALDKSFTEAKFGAAMKRYTNAIT